MKKKILVVEDNELNSKLVRSLLTIGKFEMAFAKTAEKGIEQAKAFEPDLILMDIQLPGMDGLEATRRIKEDSDLNSVPVVALTSYAMQGDEQKAIESGCIGYITKPIDTRSFLSNITQYLNNVNIK